MYYIISLERTKISDTHFTFWRKKGNGFCISKENAGIFTKIIEGYHDTPNSLPILTSVADSLLEPIKGLSTHGIATTNLVALGLKISGNRFVRI